LCGLCVRRCPTKNFSIQNGRVEQAGRCTQCYRCANFCPKQAITLWGREVQWQYRGLEAYMSHRDCPCGSCMPVNPRQPK
jgi:NAD-dependent dihydropyrimidine dehydrogenase PreA subunit